MQLKFSKKYQETLSSKFGIVAINLENVQNYKNIETISCSFRTLNTFYLYDIYFYEMTCTVVIDFSTTKNFENRQEKESDASILI